MKTVNEYKQSLIGALDYVKYSVRCLGCDGSCNECEYFLAIEKIENAIEKLGELVEKETPKPLSFEELKEGMWVWDNAKKWWIKVLEIRVANNEDDVFAEGIKIIKLGYHVFNWQEFIFEENRFYRKQVEE